MLGINIKQLDATPHYVQNVSWEVLYKEYIYIYVNLHYYRSIKIFHTNTLLHMSKFSNKLGLWDKYKS